MSNKPKQEKPSAAKVFNIKTAKQLLNLGGDYFNGRGEKTKDEKKGLELIRQAAIAGNAQAQFVLGEAYLYCKSIQQDQYGGIEWIKKAANNGYPKALLFLGHSYRYGLFIEANLDESFKYYMVSSEKGVPEARFALGEMYYFGEGTIADQGKARDYLYSANMQGYYPAEAYLHAVCGNRVHQCKIGDFYRYGTQDNSFPRNYNKAQYWYLQAVEQGSPTAARALFQMYLDELLKPTNEDDLLFVYWCHVGALLGEPFCIKWRDRTEEEADLSKFASEKDKYEKTIRNAKEFVEKIKKSSAHNSH